MNQAWLAFNQTRLQAIHPQSSTFLLVPFEMFQKNIDHGRWVVRWFVWRFAYEQIRFCAEPYCIFCVYKYVYAHNYVITWFSWTRTHTCIYYNLPCVCIYHYFFTKRNEQTLVYCGIIPGKGWAKAEWGHLRDRIDGGFSNYLDCFIDFIINFETCWYLKFFSWKIMEWKGF